jgi:hypothetical protein
MWAWDKDEKEQSLEKNMENLSPVFKTMMAGGLYH